MPFDPYTAAFDIGSGLIGSVVGLFRGMTEEESYIKQLVPVIKPYVTQNGTPVAAYWYGFSWVLLPSGQVIDINGGVKLDDVYSDPDARIEYYEFLVQSYANTIQSPVAKIHFAGGFLKSPEFTLVMPQSREEVQTPIITPITTQVPNVGGVVNISPNPAPLQNVPVQEAGFLGGDNKPMLMIGIVAITALLVFNPFKGR